MVTKLYHYKNYLSACIIFSALIFSGNILPAQPVVSLEPVVTEGLSEPIQLVNAGDGSNRMFIVQKGGTVRVYDATFNFLSNFVTVTGITNTGERGLLSMAFDPDYTDNGFFYVYYTNTSGNLELARYHVSSDPNVADASSKVIVLTIPHPTNSNHNGGELHFGADGYLYLSTGDGGGGGDQPNNAQNTSVLLGKLLRLNVNTSATPPYYSIPPGNPYGNEIYALGLRNPFRWSFDRLNNDIWIGDVGQDSYEEIDHRQGDSTLGANFGWRCYEGNNAYNTAGCAGISNYIFPVYTYPTQNPSAAITGGVVYRGSGSPALQGYYVAADFYSGTFYLINPGQEGGWNILTQTIPTTGIADFGETEIGEVYAVSLTANALYRVTAEGGTLPVTLLSFTGTWYNKQAKLQWSTSYEQDLKQFDVEYSKDGTVFTTAGEVPAKNTSTGASYDFYHTANANGPAFYRLKIIDNDGKYSYSHTVKVIFINGGQFVSPSIITEGVIKVYLGGAEYNSVEVMNTAGATVAKKEVKSPVEYVEIPAGDLLPGVYVVRLSSDTDVQTQRVLIRR